MSTRKSTRSQFLFLFFNAAFEKVAFHLQSISGLQKERLKLKKCKICPLGMVNRLIQPFTEQEQGMQGISPWTWK